MVPFNVEEPAHTRIQEIAAAQTLEGIVTPVMFLDPDGVADTIVFNNQNGPSNLIYQELDLKRKSITTEKSLVLYPVSSSVNEAGQTDLISRLGSLADSGSDQVKETVNDYLVNLIVFTDRYFESDLIDNLLKLTSGETKEINVPEGITYAAFQDTPGDDGVLLTAREQLEAFLDGTGFEVRYLVSDHPDPSRTDKLYDIEYITNAPANASGTEGDVLAFEGQYEEILKDGQIFRNLIGVSFGNSETRFIEDSIRLHRGFKITANRGMEQPL